MKKYRLFSEWREIVIIGSDFADALMRQKTLEKPDRTAYGPRYNAIGVQCGSGSSVVEKGEVLTIKTIHSTGVAPYSRGSSKPERAIVEFDNNKIVEVDALLIEVL